MEFKIKLDQVKIIWTEIGVYLKTISPFPYKAQRIPIDTNIVMEGNFAKIKISDDDYNTYKLSFFDYEKNKIFHKK